MTTTTETKPEDRLSVRALKLREEIDSHKQYPLSMRDEFFLYWTEPNRSKTKMRFETEKTWETGRRLAFWASRPWNFNRYPQAQASNRPEHRPVKIS